MSKRKNLKISTFATILIVILTNSVFNNYFINLPEPSEKPIESHSSDLIEISTNNFENINTINSENVKYDVKQLNSPEETSKKKETLEFTIPIPQLNMEEIINPEGETFNRLIMEDMYYLGQEGRPRLPVKTLQILLPYGKDLDDINIELGTPTIFEINHEIEPVQEQIPLGSNRKPEFKYETQIYDSSSPFPGNYYSIEGIHELRGYRILILNVYPVQYIPKTGELHSYEDVKVKINLNEGPKNLPLFRSLDNDEDRVRAVVDNPEELVSYQENGDSRLDLPGGSYDYVIITNEALKNSMGMYTFQDLAAYKNACGIMTTIVTVEEIYANYSGVDDQEKIRNFIIDAYNNWGIEYVLLGGDGDGSVVGGESETPIIPNRGFYCSGPSETDTNMPSDLYYAALDGNWNNDGDSYWGEVGEEDFYAEVYVGRAPVDSETELSNFIMKTLQHESTADEYMSTALMVGEDLGWSVWGGEYKDEVRNGASTNGYTTVGFPAEFTVDTLYDMDAVWSKYDLINIMNNGVHVINHLGHANVGNVMKMTNNDVDTLLTNTNYFFAYSQGCYDGAFDNRDPYSSYQNYDCIAEHFVNTPNGAFAFIGNSRYGWGNRYTTDGASQHFDREFFDAIFGEGIVEIGKANQDSKEDNVGFMSESYIRWCYYELNLFGDPTASILPQPNNYAPSLTSESSTPKFGYQNTFFNFSVVYTDADNNAPSSVDVVINGTEYRMERAQLSDINYTDGCLYQYLTYLDSSSYNFSYFFQCSDGKYSAVTTIYSDIKVNTINEHVPLLTNGQVNPDSGWMGTPFMFTVNYSDLDNNNPLFVNLMLNSTTYSMTKLDFFDNNYMDGCIFYYIINLNNTGEYSFFFNCSDGVNASNSTIYNGPSVTRGPNIGILNAESSEEPSYFTGGWGNSYTTIYNGLVSSGVIPTIVTNDDILSGIIISLDILILIDNAPSDLASPIVKDWALSGGSIISFDSSICFLNWAGLLPPEAEGTNGYASYWDYSSSSTGVVVYDDHPVMEGYDIGEIYDGVSGCAQYYSSNILSTSAGPYYTPLVKYISGSNYDYVIALEAPYAGKIVQSVDPNHWNTLSNRQMILNAINWMTKLNLYSPILTQGSVNPKLGDQGTQFNFTVIYTDQDNNAPNAVNVIINGSEYKMTKINQSDDDYIDGCVFQFSSYLPSSLYNYTYSFNCSDFYHTNATITYNDLKVEETNFEAPQLLNPQCSPLKGINSTMFNFTVEYFDGDNNLPSIMAITINDSIFSMLQVNPLDNFALDGIKYYFETMLDYGYYQFEMNCSDGGFSNSTGWMDGPEVNPFIMQSQNSLFIDDFEDQILNPDWSVDFGIASINDMISNSGSYSLAIAANGVSGTRVSSRVIDLSAYNDLDLSFWITSGHSDYSEPPDSGEDLHILYYNNLGDWVLLETFWGSASDPQTYTPSYNLPADAYHAGFRIRLLHSGGSMTSGDYWHVDDVKIPLRGAVNLLAPNNSASIYSESTDFEWTSLMLPYVTVNYSVQISDTADFSSLIYSMSGITETPATTQVSILLDFPVDQYYWRVQPTYGPFSGNWSDYFTFTLCTNDFEPQLFEGKVDPCSGNQLSTFNFSVIYYDSDNSPPVYVDVIINGTSFTMEKVNELDTNYMDGCAFDYITPLDVSEFNYTYSFECYDSIFMNTTAIYNNLEVIEVNYVAPYLFNPQLTPTSGINSTIFNFTVEYFDEDNNAPLFVNIEINNSIFSMVPLDLNDNYAIDGIQYYFETSLDYGYYRFQVDCSDGFFTNSTGWLDGPEVNPFFAPGEQNKFEDDFEDQMLVPDWIVEWGIAEINDMISNSGSFSLAIAANGGSRTRISSREMDLSKYRNLNLSLWVTSGASPYSEPPDSGENLYVYYYNNQEDWILLGSFMGSDSDPQTYTPIYNLPADALHSGFKLRLYHTGGSMTAGDYWHVDDVRIIGFREIQLVSPSNTEIIYPDSQNFVWTSLMLPHALVNYSLQISNTTDFSNIFYEQTGILESETITSTNILVNFPIGQYYWRVRPTYGPFSGNWTDYFAFTLIINEFYPQYSDITIPSNNVYAPNADYVFNCTWFDIDGAIEEVLLEFNAQNYTVNSNFAGEFTHTLSDLAANEIGYNFRWHARDNADAWNSSNWNLFVLHKQSVQLNLTFNGKENNWFLAKYISINLTVYNLDLTPGILRLYVDNKSKQETVSALLSYSKVFSSGVYNITAILTDENYTGYIMKWLIIKKPIQTDRNPNPGIPGYDIMLLLGSIGVLSFVVVKKRLIRMKT